jgi:hypothetical protein
MSKYHKYPVQVISSLSHIFIYPRRVLYKDMNNYNVLYILRAHTCIDIIVYQVSIGIHFKTCLVTNIVISNEQSKYNCHVKWILTSNLRNNL